MSYNPAILDGTHYLAGREDLDGSLRFTTDPDTGFTEIQCRISGVWQPADFETGPRSLWVGRNVGVASIGKHMATETADGMLHFHPHSHFDGETSTSDVETVRATSYLSNIPIQPDDSNEWIGTSLEFPMTPFGRSLLDKLFIKTGATAATDTVRLQVWVGSDDTGPLIFDQLYSASEFSANTTVPLVLDGNLEFDAGETVFFRYSSPQAFSLKTNAAETTPWAQISYSVLITDHLLQTQEWTDGKNWNIGDHFIDDRQLYVSNTGGTQSGTFADNATKWNSLGEISRFSRNTQTTGLVIGGLITVTSGTTLNLSAGEGFIADYSNPTNPIPTPVTWDTITGYTPTNIGVDGQYTLGFDITGTLVEIDVSTLTAQDLRDYILVGALGIQAGAIVATVLSPINVGVNGINTAKDFIRDVIGPANVKGNDISANGANLSLDNSGGIIFIPAANYRINPEVPDEVTIAPATPMTFLRFYRDAAPSEDVIVEPVGPVIVIDPTKWDDGSGTLVTIPGNRYSVQVVYVGPDGNYYVAYGQELFNTAAAAEEAVHGGTLFYDEHPAPQRFVRRAFVVMQSSTTDLTSAIFLMEAKFRFGGVLTGAIEQHSSLRQLEWDVAGHLFENGGDMNIGGYDLVTNTVRSEFGLHINPDSPGDVRFFDGTDVADATDGKRMYVYRRAAEGDSFISLYVHRDQQAHINSNVDIILSQGTSNALIITEADHVVDAPFGLKSGGDLEVTGTSTIPVINNRLVVRGSESIGGVNACIEIENTAADGDRWFLRAGATGTPTPAGAFSIADTTAYRFFIYADGVVNAPYGLQSGGADVLVSEADPVFMAWDRSTGITITTSQVTDHSYFGADLQGFTNGQMVYGNSVGAGLIGSNVLTFNGTTMQFSNTTGPKINLYGTNYALGVESSELRLASGSMTTIYTGGYSGTEVARFEAAGWLKVLAGVRAPEIWSQGDLKLQPDVNGDIVCFGDTDVGDAANGKMFYVRRQAVEGDDYIRLYVGHTRVGVISASFELTAYAPDSVTIQSGAKDIICRMGDDAGAKGTYFKNSSNAIVGSVDSLGNAQFNVSVDVPEISNTTGLLKIQPDVQGNVECFGDTDVGDTTNGKMFYVHRRAAEGNDYIRMYINAARTGYIHGSLVGGLSIQGQMPITLNSITEDVILKVGDTAGVKKVYFRDSAGVTVASIDSNGYTEILNNMLVQGPDGFDTPGETATIYLGDTNHFIKSQHTAPLTIESWNGIKLEQQSTVLARFSTDGIQLLQDVAVTGLINDGVTTYTNGCTQNSHHNLWNTTTAIYKQTFTLVTWGNGPHASAFSPDGKKVFIVDNGDEEINEFALSTPWDVSSMTWTTTMSTTTEEGNPQGLCFNLDGTKMYIVGAGGDEVNMYTLSSPWTLSTATATNLKDLTGNSTTPMGIQFKPDGKMMFISDGSLDEIQLWTLTTAWDVTTATYTTKFDTSMDNIEGFSFSPDGRRLYVVDGSGEDDIHEYDLSTPWDITTGIHSRSLDLSNHASVPNSVTFNQDGTKMYVTDNDVGVDGILEFDMGIRVEGRIHTEQLVIGEPTQPTASWTLPLEVVSADNMQANFHDSSSQAVGTGGGMGFTGHHTDAGDVAVLCAEIGAHKVNSVSGDYGFDFVIQTQVNGGTLTENLRCLSVGGVSITGPLQVDKMTTTQRDALTAVNGMIIYNTTTAAFNFREAGAWVTK